MKVRLLAILVAAMLLVAPATPSADIPKVLDSVRALAVPIEQIGYSTTDGRVRIVVDGGLTNICTVSSINEQKHYWLTAQHCVDDRTLTYFIDGDQGIVVMRDVLNDLAILHTESATAPELKLAPKGPTYADSIYVAGHPFGWPEPLLTIGTVASPVNQFTDEEGWDRPFMILQLVGAPGNSGSPVVNTSNEVVSVVQIGWGRSFSPIMGGVVYDTLAKYKKYWEHDSRSIIAIIIDIFT